MAVEQNTPIDREAVFERLERVNDPELDRSIVDLEYLEDVRIDDGRVSVTFVLPTAWCAPAFAWMMATGIRDEVGSLPGVSAVEVTLREHMHGTEINTGVNRGLAFEEAFPDAESGVADVRRKLDRKARFARQHRACKALLEAGLAPEQIVRLRPADLDLAFAEDRAAVSVRDGSLRVTVPREPLAAYLTKARETELVTDETDRMFADRDRDPIDPDAFEAVQHDARLAASNISGQGAICGALHEARNGVQTTD